MDDRPPCCGGLCWRGPAGPAGLAVSAAWCCTTVRSLAQHILPMWLTRAVCAGTVRARTADLLATSSAQATHDRAVLLLLPDLQYALCLHA